ncbi:hypothetical protein AB0957_36310, partial [Streptomyces zhihengii]
MGDTEGVGVGPGAGEEAALVVGEAVGDAEGPDGVGDGESVGDGRVAEGVGPPGVPGDGAGWMSYDVGLQPPGPRPSARRRAGRDVSSVGGIVVQGRGTAQV